MNCKNCGTAVEDGKKFCPNCGTPLTEDTPTPMPEAVPDAVPDMPETAPILDAPEQMPDAAPEAPQPAPETSAPQSQAAPQAQPQQPAGGENPYAMPGNTIPGGAGVPPMNGTPYDPTTNPIPPMGQQPKKKKKTGLIVAIILIPILIILIIIGVIVGIGVNMGTKGAKTVDKYWDAHVNCDAEALADLCPDDFWNYISDTYDLTEEEAVDAMGRYMNDYADSLGGDLSYEWSQSGVTVGFGSSSQLDTVREDTDKFGLKVSSGICVDVNCTLTGADDSEQDDYSIWTVKVNGQWCSLSAMDDFNEICDSDYAATAKYGAEFGDMLQTYWTAVANADAETLSTLVPDGWWDLVDQEYGVQQSDAESYLNSLLEEMVASQFNGESVDDIQVEITDASSYDDDELADINEGLDTYGIDGEEAMDVDVTVTTGDDSNDTYVTLTKIDGQWYVYDAMYYFATACYGTSQGGM